MSFINLLSLLLIKINDRYSFLAAIFEHDFNNQENKANLLWVSIHKVIGAGIILDQQIYRGYRGVAGEIGRMLVSSANQTKIEDICSEDAVVERLKSLKNNNNLERLDLVKLATQGD